MPKNPTNTTNPTTAREFKCHAHYHFTMAEEALYGMAMRWSDKGKKPFFFDGPKLANQYQSASKSHMYKLEKSLVKKGWLVLEVDKNRKRNGHWSSRTYRVLDHDAYILAHPNRCPELNDEGVIKAKPVPAEGTASISSQRPERERASAPGDLASALRSPSQCPEREKDCQRKTVDAKTVEEKAVGLPPATAIVKAPGRNPDRTAGYLVPPVPTEGTVDKPVPTKGTVELRSGINAGYFDSRTNKQLFFADLNLRVAPNTFHAGRFFDPSGQEISLDEAQQKEMVPA